MNHLLGKKYDIQNYDCLDFVCEYLSLERPSISRRQLELEFKKYLKPIEKPKKDCIVLFKTSTNRFHIGIVIQTLPIRVIHNPADPGFVLIEDLNQIDMKFLGYYLYVPDTL